MIEWEKYGFKESNDEYKREDFPFTMYEENGFLIVSHEEYVLSEGKIPATNQSVVLLLKAFNCPKI